MSKSKLIFSKESQNIVDFTLKQGANTVSLVKNPNTQKNFFVVEGTEITGRVSTKITKLSADLRVTWVDVEGDETGEQSSYLLHAPGSNENTLDTFSVV